MARSCVHCGARMSRLAEACPSCGGRNTPQVPWYAYALGAVLVLVLFLGLGDSAALVASVARLISPQTP
ncbi:MAG: hypothetical protein IRY94_05600 [Rhodospirillaceae bacterium]|nr:hypothetical protein [Rhodospirillaceae bacterium]